ncbi:DNA-3-methyladenine glycosylase family protein [Candidatus Latescibacterota bacterium]
METEPLTEESFEQALAFLRDTDPDLGAVLSKYGPPPMWAREPGFPTLVKIILEQQVSLASAKAAYDRLIEALGTLTPSAFLTLDGDRLKQIGFSRQKTRYCRILAQEVIDGSLDLEGIAVLDDSKVHDELTRITGIGRWTAHIYLLMALRRPDIWPRGDVALCTAVQRVKKLPSRPTYEELDVMSENWRPWRSVAARIFWHFYLSSP